MPVRLVLDAQGLSRALDELARMLQAGERPALVGIRTNGVPLAARLARRLEAVLGGSIDLGALDITLYRDDLAGRALPEVKGSELNFDVEGRRIVLVDDVLFTGRTVRAALNEIADYGRPRVVQLCVLADRGGRELPIQPDFAALKVQAATSEKVRVELTETGAPADRVVVQAS